MAKGIDWERRIGRRVRLRDLHILFAVVQSGSMAKAATLLGVSQPVVSQAITDLEVAIGVRLLDRNSRGVEPTLYGRTLLRSGKLAFDDLRQGIREIEYLADPEAGDIRIGCPESISAGLLPPVIEQLSRRYPRMVFRITQVNTLSTQLEFPELRERKLDIVMVRLVKPMGEFEFEEDLNVEQLYDDELLVVVGRESKWARRCVIELAQLANVPWILPPDSWNSLILQEAFAAIGCEMPHVGVESFSVALRYQLLATGRFVSALPGSILSLNAKPNLLKILPIELPSRPWPVVLVTLKNRTLTPALELFVKYARAIISSMPSRLSPSNPGCKR
jgi:DNA-binding transcriptional LysR family regulator